MSLFVSTLWITLIGMGLVFIGLLALWGFMELIVKFTHWYALRHPDEEEEVEEAASEETQPVEALPVPSVKKQQAAAAAVAVALALDAASEAQAPVFNQPQIGMGQASAWQAVMRSTQLNQRASQFNRKSRGNVR
jgi:Na+-transporting methylmalonyl-CoA/oxaloacetate decarboxylase gamma subunit